MYQKLPTSGGSATPQWRGAFVAPPPPSSRSSRLPSSSSLQDRGCRLKSSSQSSTNDTRLQAAFHPLSSSPLTSARPHEQARLQRGRHRARSSAARIGAGAAGANASSRNRGSLSSAAPQTVADIAVKVRRKIDQIEATAGGRGGARGRVGASGLEVGFDSDVFGDVEGASGDGMEPNGAGLGEVSGVGVPELDFLDGAQEGEEESDEYSRQLIIKLTRLAQAGSWERALEVLRDEQTVNMRARAAARAQGEEIDSSSFAVEGMAYNATLAALSKAGQWQEALLLMREMKTRGIERDTISYASVIAACGRGKQWKKALDMLAEMRAEGVAVNSFVYCSAIDACAKGGQWRKALVLLQEMEVLDCLPPNMHCMNSAIDACGKAGRQGEALTVLSRMRRVGIKPNEVSYLSAISACSRVADWQEALRLLEEMIDDGISPDLKCYSSAIAACGNGGRWNDAVRLLDDMRAAGTAPNVVCYNAAISACGKGRQWQRAVGLLDVMREKGIAPDLISYNAAIDACGKGGRWEEGLQIFVDMVKAAEAPRDPGTLAPMPPVPDATTYGAAITACSRGKQWQIALRLLDDMQERGVTRTEGVFQATLAACAKMGRWRECIVTLDKMRSSGLLPQVVAYNSVITACGRGGEWQRGLAVLQQMSSRGAKPDLITFNAAMTACAQSKQWRQALTILQFMRDPESVPTSQFGDLSLPILGSSQTLDDGVLGEGMGRDTAGGNFNGSPAGVDSNSDGVPLKRARGDVVWPPRPDAVSFHVVIKALASAGMWEKAVDVLEDMEEERDRLLRSDHASVETPGGSNKLWALDIERFRSIFRLVLRGNEIVGEPQVSGLSSEVALRAKAMDVLTGIEKKEQEAGLKRQMTYRTIARR